MMRLLIFLLAIIISGFNKGAGREEDRSQETKSLLVKKCTDFDVTGAGDSNQWTRAEWNYLTKIDSGGKNYTSKFKILYSEKGIYVLFNGDDDKISTKYKKDFGDLFKSDVFEVFFHTDPKINMYFEYEINQLDKELVLLILNRDGKFGSWMPWHYENRTKIIKKVSITGGRMKSGASIKSWSAELFFPYALLNPLSNVPPVSGMRWNANFCRLDYDSGNMIKWAWSPVKVSFHEFENYLPIIFE
jgi:Carbohydrate family 9 binding domain-like